MGARSIFRMPTTNTVCPIGQGNQVSNDGPPQSRECPCRTTWSRIVRIMHTLRASAMQRDVYVNDITFCDRLTTIFSRRWKKNICVHRTVSWTLPPPDIKIQRKQWNVYKKTCISSLIYYFINKTLLTKDRLHGLHLWRKTPLRKFWCLPSWHENWIWQPCNIHLHNVNDISFYDF